MSRFTQEEIIRQFLGEDSDLDITEITAEEFTIFFDDPQCEDSVQEFDVMVWLINELNPSFLFELLKETKWGSNDNMMCIFFMNFPDWEGIYTLIAYAVTLNTNDERLCQLLLNKDFYRNKYRDAEYVARKVGYVVSEIFLLDNLKIEELQFYTAYVLGEDSWMGKIVNCRSECDDEDLRSVALIKYWLVLAHLTAFDTTLFEKERDFLLSHLNLEFVEYSQCPKKLLQQIIKKWKPFPERHRWLVEEFATSFPGQLLMERSRNNILD
jgi:hypothetical protein